MPSNEMATLSPVAGPGRLGQATAVEQSRAVAEVLAAVRVAQDCPRDVRRAERAMLEACSSPTLADRAFYAFPRAGGAVSGPSIHLARALAAIWGNVQYSVDEMRRDDEALQSEMKAWAWDVENNVRVSATFIVPHMKDTKQGIKPLAELRDVYENNANNGARRVREAIFALLPPWFSEQAIERCRATLAKGDGRTLPERIDAALESFRKWNVEPVQLEVRMGRPTHRWTAHDVVQLGILWQSINRGELDVDVELPRVGVTADELAEPAAPAAPVQHVDMRTPEQPATVPAGEGTTTVAAGVVVLASDAQWRAVNARFLELGVTGVGKAAARRAVICHILKRDIPDPREVTDGDVKMILDNLTGDPGHRLVAHVLDWRTAPPATEAAPNDEQTPAEQGAADLRDVEAAEAAERERLEAQAAAVDPTADPQPGWNDPPPPAPDVPEAPAEDHQGWSE